MEIQTRTITKAEWDNAVNETIYRKEATSEETAKRWNFIHYGFKYKLIVPLLRFMKKRLGKYLIDDLNQIPNKWYNVNLRIFYNSFMTGLDQTWTDYLFKLKPGKFKTPKEYLEKGRQGKSYWMRKMLVDIWMTEVVEDTADREWFNKSILNMTHAVMEHYGVTAKQRAKVPTNKTYPQYMSLNNTNIPYHLFNKDRKTWRPKQ